MTIDGHAITCTACGEAENLQIGGLDPRSGWATCSCGATFGFTLTTQ